MKGYILQLLCKKKPTKEEITEIVAYIQTTSDPDVINRFIENNFPLIRRRALRYKVPGVEFEDLMQEGCIGVLDSLNDFDVTLGYAFSTYAVPKIDHRIRLFVAEHSSVIRVPRNVHNRQQRVNAAYKRHFQETGDKPCYETIADRAQVKKEDVPGLLNLIYIRTPTSLEQPTAAGGGGSTSLSDIIPDDRDFVADALEAVHWGDLRADIRHILTEEEYAAICLRFYLDETGLQFDSDENRPLRTLQACGDILGCSRENVRRILASAFRTLSEHATIRRKYACNE